MQKVMLQRLIPMMLLVLKRILMLQTQMRSVTAVSTMTLRLVLFTSERDITIRLLVDLLQEIVTQVKSAIR